jgi:hypothetical protein
VTAKYEIRYFFRKRRAQEEDSVFRIKSTKDVYHVLTDKETLDKVPQQGLKEEHKRYKDEIVEFLLI